MRPHCSRLVRAVGSSAWLGVWRFIDFRGNVRLSIVYAHFLNSDPSFFALASSRLSAKAMLALTVAKPQSFDFSSGTLRPLSRRRTQASRFRRISYLAVACWRLLPTPSRTRVERSKRACTSGSDPNNFAPLTCEIEPHNFRWIQRHHIGDAQTVSGSATGPCFVLPQRSWLVG
jgi:hypothetical protein